VAVAATEMRPYNSRGHPNANGLEIRLMYPADWEAAEGIRPHIVQRFVRRHVGDNCALEVHDLGKPVPREKIRATVREANNSGIPDGFQVTKQTDTLIDGLPAVSTLAVGKLTTVAFETAAMILITSTIYKADLIGISCVGGDSNNEDEILRKLALFVRVQNSVVIENQWSSRL
jgi:hypothetical protein